MPKIYTHSNPKPGEPDFSFNCPACKQLHGVWTSSKNNKGAKWSFNGNIDKPTITPSLDIKWYKTGTNEIVRRCHSVITAGMISFCGDCTHNLAGQVIEIPEIN